MNATVTVSLSNPSGQTVTWTTHGLRVRRWAGVDYTSESGTLVIRARGEHEAGERAGERGLADEDDESFSSTLSMRAPTRRSAATTAVTLVDDEGLPALSIADVAVIEGMSGAFPLSSR